MLLCGDLYAHVSTIFKTKFNTKSSHWWFTHLKSVNFTLCKLYLINLFLKIKTKYTHIVFQLHTPFVTLGFLNLLWRQISWKTKFNCLTEVKVTYNKIYTFTVYNLLSFLIIYITEKPSSQSAITTKSFLLPLAILPPYLNPSPIT